MNFAAERNDAYWPHLFPLPLDQKTAHVTLPCTATSSVNVKVVNPLGQPIGGAEVRFNPNGYVRGGELFIPGTGGFQQASRVRSNDRERIAAINEWAKSRFLRVVTGSDGVAKVRDLPAGERESYRVSADGFVMPVHPTSTEDDQSRYATLELAAGRTLRRTITMERFVPRTSRELLVVDRKGRPLPDINVTITEVAFDDAQDDWQLWAVQRFGPVATATTETEGITRLDAPVEIDNRHVSRLRVVVKGRVDREGVRDAYIQRDRLEIPLVADGRVVAIAVSDEVPNNPNAFYSAKAEYLAPSDFLTDSPKDLLQRLVETPSLLLLKQLLESAKFDAATPLNFAGNRNLLNSRADEQNPVAVIETDHGKRVVVLCDVRPKDAQWDVKPKLRFPPEAAFVFNPRDGSLITMLGGWASSKGSYCSLFLFNLGGTDDYFVTSSAFEEHDPFEKVTRWHRLGHEESASLVTYGYANATAWSGKKAPAEPLAEFGFAMYEFNGEDLDDNVPGLTRAGAMVPRQIYWGRRTLSRPVRRRTSKSRSSGCEVRFSWMRCAKDWALSTFISCSRTSTTPGRRS